VHLVIVLVVLLVLLGAGGLILWNRLAATCARRLDVPAGDLEDRFYGGVMCRWVMTSGVLVRLEFFEWGLRIRGMLISRWIVPTWEARYEELAIAELVSLPASRIAVCFRLRGGEANPMAFLSERSLSILPHLEKHGVPVNRSVTKIRRVKELYQ
jgi:hypothetical protein